MTDPDTYPTPEDDYQGYEDYEDRPWADDDDDRMTEIADTEWRPGECDNCSGGDEDGVTATGPLGPLYCACRIGQGAPADECQCGPIEDEETEAARAEVQPHGADATAPLPAGGSLPLPYVYRIDRPAPHRPEGEFMMSYGTWDTAPGPITTVHHAAKFAALQARILHSYWGPMTVQVWAHRGDAEHYRTDPPASAYVLQVGDQDQAEHAAEVEAIGVKGW
jgi:hypothetical protein